MEDRNQPVTQTCPFCGHAEAKLMPKLGDYDEYRCPKSTCRTYRVSGTEQQLIDDGADPKTGHFVLRGGHRYLEV
jgi:hypothetical protein